MSLDYLSLDFHARRRSALEKGEEQMMASLLNFYLGDTALWLTPRQTGTQFVTIDKR